MGNTVLLTIFTLQGNGAERFVVTLARGFLKLGYEPHIICFKNIIELPIPEGIHIHYFPYQKFRAIPKALRRPIAARFFDNFVKKKVGQPVLILSNLYPVDLILSASKLKNIYFVIHNTATKEYELDEKNQNAQNKLKKVFSIYEKKNCVCVSKGVADDLQNFVGESTNIKVIHNPVDIEFAKESSKGEPPIQAPYIVNVGKFKRAKRHDILIKAYAKSKVSCPLVLVGKGELLEKNQKLAKELGVSDKVIFSGFQKNPYPYIKNASLMVVSSDFEGFSIAILEALALETPIISTDCPSGPNEVLLPHQLTEVGNIQALADKIREATNDPKLFTIKLDSKFHPENVAKKYLLLN